MKLPNTLKEGLSYGVQGAKLGALLGSAYYLGIVVLLALVMVPLALVASANSGEHSSLSLVPILFSLFLMSLIIGIPAMLAAISLGLLTGLAIPKLLSVIRPRDKWQSAIVGVVFSSAIALVISWLSGFPSGMMILVEAPLLIYVVSTTYLSAQLPSNKDAVKNLLPSIKVNPLVPWVLAVVFMSFILYILILFLK